MATPQHNTPLPNDIAGACVVLRAGGLVAFPTETVYGLGADAENEAAVRRIFTTKGRPPGHPLIVHLADARQLEDWAVAIPAAARDLAAAFWPGPLTLILRRGPRVAPATTGGLETIGLRVPNHPVALELLRAFGGGLAAPSANRFGSVSPTTAAHVRADLGADVPIVLDGGPCSVGVESTIVDLSGVDGDDPALLRPGGITREELERVLRRPVHLRGIGTAQVRAPGQMESHYAPQAQVILVSPAELADRADRERARGQRVAVVASPALTRGLSGDVTVIELPADPQVAAQRLYACLREIDARGCTVALACLPDEAGIGQAVADRLRKAAGPRTP